MSKCERILNFKPCVYLAYLGSYGHLKIVKCIGMYFKFIFKISRNASMSLRFGWQMLQLNLWGGLKILNFNFNSKFELEKNALKWFFFF